MQNKDTAINDNQFRKLLHNDDYYKQIFKKTEKIVSVVFYILNNIDIEKKSETHTSNIASKAHFVHENALRTLEVKPASSKEVLEQFAQALIGLDSTLRVATMSNVVTEDVVTVLLNEIDVVLRGLNSFMPQSELSDHALFSPFGPTTSASANRQQTRSAQPSATPTSRPVASATAPTYNDRRERIKTILEAKGEVTIKDISEIITDVSEKTIQRELNAMIEDNVVKRQGERRWSKYSIL